MTTIALIGPGTDRLEVRLADARAPTSPADFPASLLPDGRKFQPTPKRSRLPRHWDFVLLGACFVSACLAVAHPVISRAAIAGASMSLPPPRLPSSQVVQPEVRVGAGAPSTLASAATGTGATSPIDEGRPMGAPQSVRAAIPTHWDALPLDAVPDAAGIPSEAANVASPPPAVPAAPTQTVPIPSVHRAAAYVGVWSTQASACALGRSGGHDYLTTIDVDGAWAGETRCAFRNRRVTPQGWRFDAQCANATERWTSKVGLKVVGGTLTWASQRGVETYVRCTKRLSA